MNPAKYVHLIAGSSYGITVEVIRPISSLATCPGAAVASRALGKPAAEHASGQRARGCATKRDFKRLKKKMRPSKVRKTLGTKGTKVTSAEFSLVRRYRSCGAKRQVVVNYQRATSSSKDRLVTRFR